MHTERSLRTLLFAAGIACASGALGLLAFLHAPLPPDGDPVLGGPQLIMFESEACTWCEGFRGKIAKEYQRSEFAGKAPLRYISIDDGPPPKRFRLTSFSGAPMLVFFDQYGRELDRIEKDPGTSAAVQSLVRRNLRRVAKI